MANYIKGDAVTNATSYTLHKKSSTDSAIVDEAIATQESGGPISFNLDDLIAADKLPSGTYQFAVRAHASGYVSSEYSNTVDYTIKDPNTVEKTLSEIQASMYVYNGTTGRHAQAIEELTMEADGVVVAGNAQNKYFYSNIPLQVGSEIDYTIIKGSNSNPNYNIGFDPDVGENTDWAAKAWFALPSGLMIPESHIWCAKSGNVTYLERHPEVSSSSSTKFKSAVPAVAIATIKGNATTDGDYRCKLKVLNDGFEIYVNDTKVMTMNPTGSNPYLTHTTVPVYFSFSTSTGVTIKIHSITQKIR